MIATDLDGTLLGDARVIDERDWAGLAQLGRSGIVRVIATGRSLWSAQRVIPSELPIDYLVFSSGVGTVSWPDTKLIASHVMSDEVALTVAGKLAELGLDFMAQGPAPDSHRFVYWRSGVLDNPDFEHRLELYDSFRHTHGQGQSPTTSHFVIVHPADEPDREFTRIRDMLLGLDVPLHIVRTTSPLDKSPFGSRSFRAVSPRRTVARRSPRRTGYPLPIRWRWETTTTIAICSTGPVQVTSCRTPLRLSNNNTR